MDKLVRGAISLDEAKARGQFGPLLVAVAKLSEEVGMMLKTLSVAHRVGGDSSVTWSFFDSELADLVCQVDLLCKRRATTFGKMLKEGRGRFKERLELGKRW